MLSISQDPNETLVEKKKKKSQGHLWGSTAQHEKAIFHSDHAVIGQRQRQGCCTAPGSTLQRPSLHTVSDEELVLQLHLPT